MQAEQERRSKLIKLNSQRIISLKKRIYELGYDAKEAIDNDYLAMAGSKIKEMIDLKKRIAVLKAQQRS